jgi:hypothetical protein
MLMTYLWCVEGQLKATERVFSLKKANVREGEAQHLQQRRRLC